MKFSMADVRAYFDLGGCVGAIGVEHSKLLKDLVLPSPPKYTVIGMIRDMSRRVADRVGCKARIHNAVRAEIRKL